jgi:hypothetical protein
MMSRRLWSCGAFICNLMILLAAIYSTLVVSDVVMVGVR